MGVARVPTFTRLLTRTRPANILNHSCFCQPLRDGAVHPGASPISDYFYEPARSPRRIGAPALAQTAALLRGSDARRLRRFCASTSPLSEGRSPRQLRGITCSLPRRSLRRCSWRTAGRPPASTGGLVAPVRTMDFMVIRGASYLLSLINHHVGQGWLTYFVVARLPRAALAGGRRDAVRLRDDFRLSVRARGAGFPYNHGQIPWLLPTVGVLAIAAAVYGAVIGVGVDALRRRQATAPLFEAGIKGHLSCARRANAARVVQFLGTWIPLRFFGVNVPFYRRTGLRAGDHAGADAADHAARPRDPRRDRDRASGGLRRGSAGSGRRRRCSSNVDLGLLADAGTAADLATVHAPRTAFARRTWSLVTAKSLRCTLPTA